MSTIINKIGWLLVGMALAIPLMPAKHMVIVPEECETAQQEQTNKPDLPPVLLAIAECESGNRQYERNGEVLRGEINPSDIGLFQINEKYHLQTAQMLGIDIYTPEGNTAYAIYLYETEGTKPWIWSRKCWEKKIKEHEI